MIPGIPDRAVPPVSSVARCTVVAHAIVEARAAEVPTLRTRQAQVWAPRLPAPLIRQADDQTILGLAALGQALESADFGADAFSAWTVLAAPRFLGRAAQAASLERSRTDGPWGVSPHFVAHRSLHALPGTASLALRARGPNLGVGGGPGGEGDALLTAVTFLQSGEVPGVWVLLTGFDPEPVPTRQGEIPADALCRAVAVALTPDRPGHAGLRLHVRWSRRELRADREAEGTGFTLEALATMLAEVGEGSAPWARRLEHVLVEIEPPGAVREWQR